MQEGIIYTRLIDLGFARINFSESDPSSYWNYALTDKILTREQVEEIEIILSSLARSSTIYFENTPSLVALINKLKNYNYEKKFQDSWMFYEKQSVNDDKFSDIKKVDNIALLNVYIQILNKCYRNDDPKNPYGELGHYLDTARHDWIRTRQLDKLEYFIAYKNGMPVAVSALTSGNGIGYISNVGSLKDVRGEGYGKAVTLFCVEQSLKKGNMYHCLATEEGTYPNRFYERIGFTTYFTACAYSQR